MCSFNECLLACLPCIPTCLLPTQCPARRRRTRATSPSRTLLGTPDLDLLQARRRKHQASIGSRLPIPFVGAGSITARLCRLLPAGVREGCSSLTDCRRRSAARSQAVLKRSRNLPCGKQAFGFRWTRVGGCCPNKVFGDQEIVSEGAWTSHSSALTSTPPRPPPTHLWCRDTR